MRVSHRLGALLPASLLLLWTSALHAATPLEKRLQEVLRRFHGVMGVAAMNLDTGEVVAINADTRFPTASLIKVAVMVEVYHQIARGNLRRDTSITLAETDKAGDETVPLNVLHAGTTLTVADLLKLMIAYSDNTATNLLVRMVTTEAVDERLTAYGIQNMKLFRPTFRDGKADVFPELEKEFGLGMATPRDALRLFALIAEGKVIDRATCDEMLAILGLQQDRAMIPRSLPFERDAIFVANKTGWDAEKVPDAKGFQGDVRADAAYVKGPKARYVVAICARRIQDKRPTVDNEALVTGAMVSRLIYDHFQAGTSPALTPRSLKP